MFMVNGTLLLTGARYFVIKAPSSTVAAIKLTNAQNTGYHGGISVLEGETNSFGVYSKQYGRDHKWFYLVTTPGTPCPNPPSATALRISKYTPPRTRA